MPSADHVVAVDPTGFAVSNLLIGDLSTGIHNVLGQSAPTLEPVAEVSKSYQASQRGAWVSAFGSIGQTGASGSLASVDSHFAGVIAGYDTGAINIFAGGSSGSADVQGNASQTDISSAFAGLSWDGGLGNYDLNLSLVAGTANHEHERNVANNTVSGGVETASANYDGWFISPAATFSKPVSVAARDAIGSLRVGYTGLFMDGYTETGVTNNASIDARDVHILDVRAQLALPSNTTNKDGSQQNVEWRAGLVGQFDLSSDVTGAVAGGALNFDASANDLLGGFAGASFKRVSEDGLKTFSANGELQASSGGHIQLSGGLKYNIRF